MVEHPIGPLPLLLNPLSSPSSSIASVGPTASSASDDVRCQVCEVAGDTNLHFGAITCRACAEFFRRSVHASRTYKCKKVLPLADGTSKIKNCRHCRLQKCQEIGMLSDAVDSRLLLRRRMRKELCKCKQQAECTTSSLQTNSSIVFPFSNFETKDMEEMQMFVSMLNLFKRFKKAYFCQRFPMDVLAQTFTFGSLKDILEWANRFNFFDNDNLLDKTPLQKWPKKGQMVREVASCYQCRNGTMNFCMTQSLLVLFNLAKTIGIFGKIGIEDKMHHLSSVGMPFMLFCYYHHSCEVNIGTLLNRDSSPVMPMFFEEKYAGDRIVCKIADYMFIRAFKYFQQYEACVEEYALLNAIILTQPVSLNLSQEGREMLQTESEKYAAMLLAFLQRKLGILPGANRYSELLTLIQLAFHSARKRYEFINYLDIFYENGKIHKTIPRALTSFSTLGDLE